MMNNPQIILATSSPYRQKVFSGLGIDFVAKESKVDEYSKSRPKTPTELVLYLAKLKTDKVSESLDKGIVIGFDSVGWFVEQILEKPKSKAEAFSRLKSLSGKTFQYYTGIYMQNVKTGCSASEVVVTECDMRQISDSEINRYLNQDSSFKTYGIGFNPWTYYSSTFIKAIRGSYHNILSGTPVELIVEMLPKVGFVP